MDIKLGYEKDFKTDIEIIICKDLKKLDKNIIKEFKKLGFEGKESQSIFWENRLYIGASLLKGEDLKIAFSTGIREILKTKYKNILIKTVNKDIELDIKEIVEGILLGSYMFESYKSKKIQREVEVLLDISNSNTNKKKLIKKFEESVSICKSVNMVRDIVNTPPEDFYPKTMALKAKEVASKNGLQCKIYGEDYLKQHGMNAMYSVGLASRHESQLIHLSYKSKNSKGKVVLVGKGLTYDCGGLSLKPANGMVSMKCDKSGASAVLGIMNTLSSLGCEYEVHGILGAVENMIGGNAYKPDDVLTAKNGKTIEVRNTDAEGRLVLADCLCYAQDNIKDIDYIFDFATLTGACIIGLGEYTSAVLGHNEKLKNKINKASKKSGELVGFLPFNRYLPKMLQSNIADMVNSTTSKAGATITAALFLDNFIKNKNKKKWLHFDIAGPSYREKTWGYNAYGATGAGVRLLIEFIKGLK